MKLDEILTAVRAAKDALNKPIDGMTRECIGCKPIVDALLLLSDLERKLEAGDHAQPL